MSTHTEEKRFKAFMNKKPTNVQIMARIKKIAAGKTPQSAKKFEVMKWGLQNSPNNTHYKMSEAMFNMQTESGTGFWNTRENRMVNKFNIPQNLVTRKLSNFTPRKKPAPTAPKKATPKKATPKKAAPKKAVSEKVLYSVRALDMTAKQIMRQISPNSRSIKNLRLLIEQGELQRKVLKVPKSIETTFDAVIDETRKYVRNPIVRKSFSLALSKFTQAVTKIELPHIAAWAKKL